mmetsp:Transcript_15183/g.23446  ORF Transcript_15183/g.23446 Transcript_15183/m.23446 type:complete len:88 (-) Transcript_15183:1090-1353(-)
MPEDLYTSFKTLYLNAILYFLLALYCDQVVPQQYGIPKHPLFLFEELIKRVSPDLHRMIFGNDDFHLLAVKDDNELANEDSDAKRER